MTEAEFIAAIDGALPYDQPDAVARLTERAAHVSSNAQFMVLHEICRPPRSARIDIGGRLDLLAQWAQQVEHPLNAVLLPIAGSLVRGDDVPAPAALAAMREVARFPGLHNALAIPYFACDDEEGQVEALHRCIVGAWSSPCGTDEDDLT